jgi:chromosomal replication initiator protein
MELVKDLKTKNTDYMIIRNMIGKMPYSINVLRSKCYKHNIKDAESKIKFLIDCGQLEQGVDGMITVSKDNKLSYHSAVLVDDVVDGSLTTTKILTIDKILDSVCVFFDIDKESVKSKRRFREIVICRQSYCHIAKYNTQASLKGIGKIIGGRHHTTVLHSLTTIDNELFSNKRFRETYDELLRFVLLRA